MKGSGKENRQSAVESNLSEGLCCSPLTSENVSKYQWTAFTYRNITQHLTDSVCIFQAVLIVVENRQLLYGQRHPFLCTLVTLLSHGMVACPVGTNKSSHFYLMKKCMKFTGVAAGFYPYVPALIQCLLHSFAISLRRTNVITLHNWLVSNTCCTSNLNNHLKIIHEDSILLKLLPLAVQVTLPGRMVLRQETNILCVAYSFLQLLVYHKI